MDGIKALIFDYGGTIDSGGRHWAYVMLDAYRAAGLNVNIDDFRRAFVTAERAIEASAPFCPADGFLTVLTHKATLQLRALGLPESYARPVAEICFGIATEHTAEAREILLRLKSRFPIALVSNFYGNLREGVLPEMQLGGIFECVVDSTEAGIRKPDSAIFAIALHSLRMPPENVAVIGDSVKNDILPAHGLGCGTVLVDGTGWEGRPSSAHTQIPATTVVIDSLNELPRVFNTN